RRALRHYRGGGRRGFEPRHLVRDPHRVSRDRAGPCLPVVVRRTEFPHRRSVGSRSLRCGRHRDLSAQGRHDSHARGVLRRRNSSVPFGSALVRAGSAYRRGLLGTPPSGGSLKRQVLEGLGTVKPVSSNRRRSSCVLFTCSRFAPWRRLAAPPAPRRSTGRKSMKRSDEALPYPATCTATDFPAPTSR